MILDSIESVKLDAPFAEKKVDINNGDIVKILSDAMKQPDRFNPGKFQTLIKIETINGPRYVNLNQSSINILIGEFKTNDAARWIGQSAKVLLKAGVFAGKKGYALYLVGQGWELDEYGSPFCNDGSQATQNEEIPTIQMEEESPFDGVL